jgi:hypothetical protein
MPEARKPSQRPQRGIPVPPRRGPRRQSEEPRTFRERLRRDPFLFSLCLGFLAFTTWALAVTWRLMGDPTLLALTVLSVVPAFYLFYLRDRPST